MSGVKGKQNHPIDLYPGLLGFTVQSFRNIKKQKRGEEIERRHRCIGQKGEEEKVRVLSKGNLIRNDYRL